jgi:hypothetical protein
MCGKACEGGTGVANSNEHNTAARPSSLTRREPPKGANTAQSELSLREKGCPGVVAFLTKGTPLSAGRALPWPLWVALMAREFTGRDIHRGVRCGCVNKQP